MHEASALVAGATLAAARAVWAGEADHGASIAGGLHHAMRGNASGFCVYNDPAIDRKSVVKGKSVDLGGRRIIKKKKQTKITGDKRHESEGDALNHGVSRKNTI